MDNNKEIGLYIHIPFCKAKCCYCDFNSFPGKEDIIPYYFNALKEDILINSGRFNDCLVKSIFIGGGTPSLVDAYYISETMSLLRNSFNIKNGAEISLESNPGTLSYDKLKSYIDVGINRLSIGLQAWQNSLLKILGRIHRIEEFVLNYELAKKAGFKNINVDLIFAIPGQSLGDWTDTIKNVAALNPSHISCYDLKIEEGTEFEKQFDSGSLVPLDDELDRQMYHETIDILKKYGYNQYEISNFAMDEKECRHNLIYWKAEEYIGLGAGSHSYTNDKRYNNVYDINSYIKSLENKEIPIENIEEIDQKESMKEYMFLGLRLIDGISSIEFKSRFGKDINEVFGDEIESLVGRKLIVREYDKIKLTSYGLDMANQAFMEFV